MAICPAGHETSAHDFCDTCGLPVQAQSPASATEVAPAQAPSAVLPVICPHCETPNVADALFCEACGYDFTTGTLPEVAVPVAPTAAEPEALAALAAPPQDPAAVVPEPGVAAASTAATAPDAATLPEPVLPPRPVVEWVAELWIDPDWYAAQGSSDPMPSPSLPDIAPLVKENNLIGRVSHSRGIFPDIDCELDSGCSRRHAMLSTDGNRWWIEDLDSANGTFVGAAAGPLPGMPIPQGRVELNPGQRIYVGAWTRIVVRKATEDEKVAFA
ncbi:MAG TPA: FHA domain-containing protein [Propionicimonas sp.]|nr:FHA domain-containing protein [Propionicimonas sp.]